MADNALLTNENELAKSENYTYGKANFIVVNADVQCDDAIDQTTKLKNDDLDGVDTGHGKQMFDTNTDKKYFKEEKFPKTCKHTGEACDIDLYSPWFNAAEITYTKTNMAPLNEYYDSMSEVKSEIQKLEGEIQNDNEDFINFLWLQTDEKNRRKAVRELSSNQRIDDRLDGSVKSGKEDISAYTTILDNYKGADLGDKSYDFSSVEGKLKTASEKLNAVEEMLKEKNESKHPLKKESEAVCWKGGLITITTYGQQLTDQEISDEIKSLIEAYKTEGTSEEDKAKILEKLKALDPPPVLKKDADGKRYYGISESAWQLKVVGWNESVLNPDVINYTLKTFDILTPQQQRIFFAQCAAETGFGKDREEKESKWRPETWWGAGSIQLTHEENYELFKKYMDDHYNKDGNVYDFNSITSSETSAPAYVGENYFWMAGGFWWDHYDVNNRLIGKHRNTERGIPVVEGDKSTIPFDPIQDNYGISLAIQQGPWADPVTWPTVPSHWEEREKNHSELEGIFIIDENTNDADPIPTPVHNSKPKGE